MAKALRSKANRSTIAGPFTLPAPTKGWYVGANLSEAPPGTAYVLDNAFCGLDYVRARGGAIAWATGMPAGPVNTLIAYNSALSKMFAVRGGSIYDVSSSGAVISPMVSGLASDYLEYTQFTGTGGTFLLAVNGFDPIQIFNGVSWTTSPATTGMNFAPSFVWTYKNRVYLAESGTLDAWYLGLSSIGGAATKFPLSGIFKWGGYLLCGGTWAIDSTSGIYEACVFISSEGEIAVYNGDYPGATNWTLVGTYKGSKPLGKRCLMKAGGDLAIMTEDGIMPMSKVETLDQIALQNQAITMPIAPAWRDAVLLRQGLTGWQLIMWPLQSMGIVNLPKSDANDKTQFIANARTGAWSRYLGWDANCFAVVNNSLFFGSSDGRVMQAEMGGEDDTLPYTVTIFPSYTDCGKTGARKSVRMVRPMVQTNFSGGVQVTVKFDFDTELPHAPSPTGSTLAGTALWDVAKWDVAVWPRTLIPQANWLAAFGLGYVLSPVVQLTLSQVATPDMRLTTIDVLVESGNALG